MISSDTTQSELLRHQYLSEELSAEAFVDQVLVPFQKEPVIPDGLIQPGSKYLPSSQTMKPSIAKRFHGLAWDLIERSTEDELVRGRAIDAVDQLLGRSEGDLLPGRPVKTMADSELVEIYCELVRVATGCLDPYQALKRDFDDQALSHLKEISHRLDEVSGEREKVTAAIDLGIIGNAIDFADPTRKAHLDAKGFDMASEIKQAGNLPYVIDQREAFLSVFETTPKGELLFLMDNAGEAIFDLVLVKCFLDRGWKVTLAGKSLPCYNDMTAEDLSDLLKDPRAQAYLGKRVEPIHVISSGTAMIGLDLRRGTPEFVERWRRADVVYAKGQGMLQTLRYAPLMREIFHAVQVKDPDYFHEGISVQSGDALFLHTATKT